LQQDANEAQRRAWQKWQNTARQTRQHKNYSKNNPEYIHREQKLMKFKLTNYIMLHISNIHHIAIICSDYEVSKKFYTEVLGFRVMGEYYRAERKSYKLDLALGNRYVIELFSFPDPPPRVSQPEARGLRHLAFEVSDIEASAKMLTSHGIKTEPIRIDEFTGKRFTFFADPDNLPLELYES
jgi:glyoxylase I family protein